MNNLKTTIFGLIAGLPPIIIASAAGANFPLPAWALMTLSIVSGVGAILTGAAAKDATTHSTSAEVQAATTEKK